MSGGLRLSVLLGLAVGAHGGTAKPAAQRERYESSVTGWKDSRKAVQEILNRLRAELQRRPLALQAVDQLVRRWRQKQALQNGLHKKLVENQDEALSAGVIDRARHDIHVAKLDRLLAERMLVLWGHDAPSELNEALKSLADGAALKGFPYAVYPSTETFERFQLKDFVPIYDEAEKRMKTQQE